MSSKILQKSFYLAACVWLAGFASASPASDPGLELFEQRIRPALIRYCYECHSAAATKLKGGLRLDSRDLLRQGGESGPAIIPGKPEESLLIKALRHDTLEMPPKKKLPESVIHAFVEWIQMGAPDPRHAPPNAQEINALTWESILAERKQWWSLQPVRKPSPPKVRDSFWVQSPIDRFILAKLEEQGLHPAAHAEPSVLLRRATFVLTGLPPSPEEVAKFEAASNQEASIAFEALVDGLLASPRFGERWARHWMDVVRYGDTYGYEWDIPAKGAWRYRDYLIRAFNCDVPFDQLVREQIAGDLLEAPRISQADQIDESLAGTMFFRLGENRHGDSAMFDGIHQEMLDNQIDAFGKTFLATTIACARCHDHKIDAVSQRDYYALAGVFMSSRWVTQTLDTPRRNGEILNQLRSIKREMRARLAKVWFEDVRRAGEYLLAVQAEIGGAQSVSENFSKGTTSYQPISSGNLPDERNAVSIKNSDSGFGVTLAAIPVGKPPAPPIFQTKLSHDRLDAWRKVLLSANRKKSSIEDLISPWLRMVETNAGNANISERWRALAAEHAVESRKRIETNQAQFILLADFRNGIPKGWSADGVGVSQGAGRAGDFTVALEGTNFIGQMLPAGLFTHALSPRLNGSVRTPYLNTLTKAKISIESCGGDFAAHRIVVDNAFLAERQEYLKGKTPGWLRFSTFPEMKDRRIYVEFATKSSNGNFPPRVGLGGACSEEQAADPRSWFGFTRVVLHDKDATPADELTRFENLFAGDAPRDLAGVAQRYANWFSSAIDSWKRDEASDDDVRLLSWLLSEGLISNQKNLRGGEEIDRLVDQYRQLEKQLAEPQTINAMADVEAGYDYRFHGRGDYDDLREPVPRRFLQVLTGTTKGFGVSGSGRRELAELVASPTNPLTARVFVNRIWSWIFGTGLVGTPNDFGRLGDLPSHPELLDYLARHFVETGWSTKKLIREIVLSATFGQSCQVDESARARDPDNHLLHHFPSQRLEAEAIRDAVLAVSGRMDFRLFGPPINPHRQNEDAQKRLFSGPIDSEGRRSLYIKVTLMEPPKFLATFNQPNPKIPTGKRDRTNVPAQALALLNDPLIAKQAEYWANRIVQGPHASPAQRLTEMFVRALGRKPSDEELNRWTTAIADLAVAHGVGADAAMQCVPVLKDVAHALFNTKEFIYLR